MNMRKKKTFFSKNRSNLKKEHKEVAGEKNKKALCLGGEKKGI